MQDLKNASILTLIIAVGSLLRLVNLGVPPLWVDEGLFINFWKIGARQEFIPVWINHLFAPTTEFWIRFPFALAGILTIPAIYLAIKDKTHALLAAGVFATFPIFVFWSRLARPYAFVGLFIVLAWRWWPFYFAGLLTSPVTMLGIDLVKLKKRWWIYAAMLAVAIGMYLIRPDSHESSKFFSPNFILKDKRQWYVPLLAGLLYLFDYGIPLVGQIRDRIQTRQGHLG